ncbi:unnamed protein product, partial [Anisakis simplex]|uniref:Uncharacterized protein n=1 Tax=Anisakis simplex TaxID=6269 RepID=A0A0M3J3N6_ANISI
MAAIAENMNQIPRSIEVILELLNQHSSEQIRFQLPAQVNKIRCTVEDSIKNSHSLELHFHKAMRLMNDRRKSIGRAGFELLGEVKLFWSSVISFCEELNKLIHYTLDSSTNAFNSILRTQYEIAQKQNKFSLKRKTREEIYHSSLAMIAYAWAVRHLANAYIHYSSQFIMPQINVIARYPLIATNKIEFAKAQQQFRELNMACEQETNKMVGINSTESKRRSILKMDMGLNLNLNEIGRDIDEIIQPVAEFRTGKLQFNHEFELDNQERSMMLTNERRSREEQKNKLKMEKKRVKEEETIKKERHKREKEEVEKRLKEENKRIKEETKKRKQQEREQRKQLDRSNSERKASWNRSSSTRSGSPQSPQSLQFDLSLP